MYLLKRVASTLYTIIDWEDFTPCAPIAVDLVSIWLGKNHSKLKSTFKPNIEVLSEDFIDFFSNESIGIINAVIALIYLARIGNDLALIFCKIGK